MQTYYFKGVVTAEEPLTVTVKSSAAGRLPRNGGYQSCPFMPATSFRGALRHASHQALNKFMKGKGARFDLAEHFALAQGVDIENRATDFDAGDIDAGVKLRAANPFISLWGRWGLGGHAGIGNMYPLKADGCTGEFGGGNRTIMFERSPDLLSFMTDDEIERLNTILVEQSQSSEDMKPIKAEIKSLVSSLRMLEDSETKARVKSKIAELEAKLSDIKEAKTGPKDAIRRPLDSFEAFVAGCEFSHRMAIQCASDAELGLFITALHEFSRAPYLGGHRAHNCGRVSAKYDVTIYPEGSDAHIPVGSVAFSDDGFQLEGDILVSARHSWKSDNFDFKVW